MEVRSFVSEESAALAQSMERKFLKIPPGVGVVFVSVTPLPVPGGKCNTFDVVLGIERSLGSVETGAAIVKHILQEEMETGLINLRAQICRGQRLSA